MAHAGGRPKKYQYDDIKKIFNKVCNSLATGISLTKLCKQDDMPDISMICDWLNLYPEFSEQYARAREIQADYLASEILDIASETEIVAKYNGEDVKLELTNVGVQRNKLRVDANKWYASKLCSKKYGDKTILSNDPENPFKSSNESIDDIKKDIIAIESRLKDGDKK